MPIVRIDIQSGKTTAHKRAILHGVRKAMTETLGIPDDRIMQRIVECPAENIDTTEVKSDRLTIVQISMLPRTNELKADLYVAIARHLGFDPGIDEHDLVVIVNDPPAECFYINGAMQCTPVTAPEQPNVAAAPQEDA